MGLLERLERILMHKDDRFSSTKELRDRIESKIPNSRVIIVGGYVVLEMRYALKLENEDEKFKVTSITPNNFDKIRR